MFSIKIPCAHIESIEPDDFGFITINFKPVMINDVSSYSTPVHVSPQQTIEFNDDGYILIQQ